MKLRNLAWILVPALMGAAVYAARTGDWARRFAVLRGADPVLECPRLLELGERELGEVALARFTIANRGGRELVVDEFRSNCSCSGLEREEDGEFFRLDSLRVGPHEQTEVVMRVSVQGSPGDPAQNRVSFRTNDPACRTGAIETLVSKVKAGVTTVPTSAVFGTLTAGNSARQLLDVFDGAQRPRTIERVVSLAPDRVSVQLLSLDDAVAGSAVPDLGTRIGRIEVTALGQEPGTLATDIQIYLGDERVPTVIPVSGRVEGPIEVSPATLVLPRASSAGPVYFGQCLCRSTAGKPLAVNIESVPAGISARIETEESVPSQQWIRIEWNPVQDGQDNAGVRRTVRLKTRVENHHIDVEIHVICLKKSRD
jgi:hypothetical protein